MMLWSFCGAQAATCAAQAPPVCRYHLGTAFGEGSAYGGPGTAIGGTRTHLADNVDAICQTLVGTVLVF